MGAILSLLDHPIRKRLANSSGFSLPAIAFDTHLPVAHDRAIVKFEESLGKPTEV
jgi:hypothetical protein